MLLITYCVALKILMRGFNMCWRILFGWPGSRLERVPVALEEAVCESFCSEPDPRIAKLRSAGQPRAAVPTQIFSATLIRATCARRPFSGWDVLRKL